MRLENELEVLKIQIEKLKLQVKYYCVNTDIDLDTRYNLLTQYGDMLHLNHYKVLQTIDINYYFEILECDVLNVLGIEEAISSSQSDNIEETLLAFKTEVCKLGIFNLHKI